MRAAFGHDDRPAVGCRQLGGEMPAEGGRAAAQVEHHVPQRPLQAGDDLGLGGGAQLVVQAAQGAGPFAERHVGLRHMARSTPIARSSSRQKQRANQPRSSLSGRVSSSTTPGIGRASTWKCCGLSTPWRRTLLPQAAQALLVGHGVDAGPVAAASDTPSAAGRSTRRASGPAPIRSSRPSTDSRGRHGGR